LAVERMTEVAEMTQKLLANVFRQLDDRTQSLNKPSSTGSQ
jgi:hypothetical protein